MAVGSITRGSVDRQRRAPARHAVGGSTRARTPWGREGVRAARAEEPTHFRAEPLSETRPSAGGVHAFTRRTLFALGLEQSAQLDGDTLVKAARDACIDVHRTRPSLVLRYSVGTHEETDRRCAELTRGHLRRGWVLEIRERVVAMRNVDDVYWHVKRGEKVHVYRSASQLRAAKLI